MKNYRSIYKRLLKLYPRNFREAFGAQMMQTFSDNYQDVEKSEGRVSLMFWLDMIADEIKNIGRQHVASLTEENNSLKITTAKSVLSALFLLPLYVAFYVTLVKVSLALPHPPLSGIGVVIALAALLLLPAALSVVTGFVLASALTGLFSTLFAKRKVRIA